MVLSLPPTIAPPKDNNLLLCQRACDDEAKCGCRGNGVAVGMVVAADDVNGDGRLDAEEVTAASYGRGYFVVVHSDKDHPVAPRPLNAVFTDGIERGTAAYRFVAAGGAPRQGAPGRVLRDEPVRQAGTRVRAPVPGPARVLR